MRILVIVFTPESQDSANPERIQPRNLMSFLPRVKSLRHICFRYEGIEEKAKASEGTTDLANWAVNFNFAVYVVTLN